MKINLTLLLITLSVISFAQTKELDKYRQADSLLQKDQLREAYDILKELKNEVSKTDTLYPYVIWYYTGAATGLEAGFRMKEDFNNSLTYGLEALKAIQENKSLFDAQFAEREAWMTKNIVISYFGLGKLEEAVKYKQILYQGYKDKVLPKGIDGYFNFDFFTLDKKNIWGYEWYPELPDDRFSTSFTKVVYYVYSTNPDGSDKDQLCRFHVLMFHQDSKDTKFDYILEKQQEIDKSTVSGSYYSYLYKKDIDYKKLKEDIKEIVRNNVQPDTKRTVTNNR